jgi:hypothetical protein
MVVRLAALRAGRPLPLRIYPRATVRLEELGKLRKKINDLIGIRSRDLPACSIVPQPRLLFSPCEVVIQEWS